MSDRIEPYQRIMFSGLWLIGVSTTFLGEETKNL